MTNQPIEEKWKERLRDLYLITVPDANDLFTKSITFNWGKFVYEPKEQYTEFYLTTKESIESFIENLLEQERRHSCIAGHCEHSRIGICMKCASAHLETTAKTMREVEKLAAEQERNEECTCLGCKNKRSVFCDYHSEKFN